MYYSRCDQVCPLNSPQLMAGEWFLRGFADAYQAHQVVAPAGPAGDEYHRGYVIGLEAVQRDFFAAIWNGYERHTSLVDTQGARWPLSVMPVPMSA